MSNAEWNLKEQEPAITALNDFRQAEGMSLGDMEEKSGVSVNSVYAWRSGARSPQLHLLVAVAEALGFEIVMRRKSVSLTVEPSPMNGESANCYPNESTPLMDRRDEDFGPIISSRDIQSPG